MQVDYYAKYLKYKQKYLDLKEEMIGSGVDVCEAPITFKKIIRPTKEDYIAGKPAKEDDAKNHITGNAKYACNYYNEILDQELYYESAMKHKARCKKCEGAPEITPVPLKII